MTVQCFIPGIPAPKGSMRAFKTKGGRVVTTHANEKTRPWQSVVQLAMSDAMGGRAPFGRGVALAVRMNFYLPQPKTVRRPFPSTRPDIDKLIRCCLDAMTGVVFVDDSQVVALEVGKYFAGKGQPGVNVTVTGDV